MVWITQIVWLRSAVLNYASLAATTPTRSKHADRRAAWCSMRPRNWKLRYGRKSLFQKYRSASGTAC